MTPHRRLRIGFVALTDAAPVIMAKELGLYGGRGLGVELVKQASWPGLRDALLRGELEAAHCLCSMPLAVATGVGGGRGGRMPIAMILAANGQAITLEVGLAAAGHADLAAAGAEIAARSANRALTLAMTYRGGTHDIWLRYWLAAAGVDAGSVTIIPIPPPQMVAAMRMGALDGYSVGEPWNAVAVEQGIGFTAVTSQAILPHHPEKALVVNDRFLAHRRSEVEELVAATLAACAWLDVPDNRRRAAQAISVPGYVNAPVAAIEGRMLGRYELGAGLGAVRSGGDHLAFHRGGAVNAPRRGHAIWFMAQFRRLGLLARDPDYLAVADDLMLRDLYEGVAHAEGVPVPADDMEPFVVPLDGARFDPERPEREATRRVGRQRDHVSLRPA